MIHLFLRAIASECSLTIRDYSGFEIIGPNPTINRGFKATQSSGCSGIKVTLTQPKGEITTTDFISGGAYWEPGEYKFSGTTSETKITISTLEDNKPFTHFVFFHISSHPFLLSMLEFVKGNDISQLAEKSVYFYYQRANTFSTDKIRSIFGKKLGDVKTSFSPGDAAVAIYNIYKNNPDAKVWFAHEDIHVQKGPQFFDSLGLVQNRYQDNMFSDGSFTYEIFNRYKNDNAEQIKDKKARLEQIVQLSRDNNTGSLQSYFDWSRNDPAGLLDLIFIQAATNGHRLIVLHPSLLEPSSDPMKNLMKELEPNLNVEWPGGIIEGFHTLSDEKKNIYNELANFNKADFEKNYLSKDKKSLVILGSRAGGKFGTDLYFRDKRGFEGGLNVLDVMYGGDYKFAYKPHPAQDMSETGPILESRGIPVIPGQLPAEIFLWQFSDSIYLGGYLSTVLLSSKPERTTVIYLPSSASLTGIWRDIYDGHFTILKGTLFMKPLYDSELSDSLKLKYDPWVVGISVVIPVVLVVIGFVVIYFLYFRVKTEGVTPEV